MATYRARKLRDGTEYWQVRYRINGVESSKSLDNEPDAKVFCELVNAVGPARALELNGITHTVRSMTVSKWVLHHINHLSGVERRTTHEYLGVLKNNIDPVIGTIPLAELSRDDIARWLETMRTDGSSGKTIANKHGLLSAALNSAVTAGHIGSNPAAGVRLPRTEKLEMRCLTKEEFGQLAAAITEPWRPMVRFLVSSGCRISEATALRPSDVDRTKNSVRISRAWKRGPGGYTIGPPKTQRSIRTINLPAAVLDELDYSGLWLFTNPGTGNRADGGPVRAPNFRANVWYPAVARAGLPDPQPRIHDLRHTCASWLIQAGRPLPAVQAQLGHESIKTTVDVYGHLDRSSGQGNADVIGNMLA